MRRALVAGLVLAAVLACAAPAGAHPLGNFSVNHLSEVRISADRIEVRYVLDQAEIPTVRERGDSPEAVLARKRGEVERGLGLTVDGRPVPLSSGAGRAHRVPARPGRSAHDAGRDRAERAGRRSAPRRAERRDVPRPARLEGDRRRARATAPPCDRASRRGT